MPAPTLAEVLTKSGWTKEQIDALDAKAVAGFTGVLTAADQSYQEALAKEKTAQEAAVKAEADRKAAEASMLAAKTAQEATELSKRSVDEFWNNTYNPGVAAWEAERTTLAKKASDAAAEAAYYKTQREGYLSTLGIKPEDAPVFTPTATDPARDNSGKFVAGAPGGTPGSPTFMDPTQIAGRIGDVAGALTDVQWKYQSLYGKPLPISPSELIKQADARKLSPTDYASSLFKFPEREQELAQKQREEHEAAIRAEEGAKVKTDYEAKLKAQQDEFTAKERKFAEEHRGNNPDVHVPSGSSRLAEIQRAVKAGDRPDPLKMTDSQRRQATRQSIHAAIEERETAVA